MDIKALVVGGGPVASLVVLTPHAHDTFDGVELPIKVGSVEAAAISLGIEGNPTTRPITHDLLCNVIDSLRARLTGVEIVRVEGTTFYARLLLLDADCRHLEVDARPSDAIALAVRLHVPLFASEEVLEQAAMPDFGGVERAQNERNLEEFHAFVENLSPEDFA